MTFKEGFDYAVGAASMASMVASFLALKGVNSIKNQINLTSSNRDSSIAGDVRFKASGGNINQSAGDMNVNKPK